LSGSEESREDELVLKSNKYESSALEKTESGREGICFDPAFCPADCLDPYSSVEWEERTASIQGEGGEVVFEQEGVAVPKEWSQLATNVVVSKYFYGEVGTPERETSVRQIIDRVTSTIAEWGWEDGYFASTGDRDVFCRDLAWLCLHQYGAFNSPVWFNVGLFQKYGKEGGRAGYCWSEEEGRVVPVESAYRTPQVSACFIQSVEDNMEGIMDLAKSEAMLFKFGSGTGTDLSPLRSHREKLAGGGRPSGPLSFMRVYDQIAAVIKSGGKTRRAAKMQSLKIGHPDIVEFIEAKTSEEAKAHALIRQGYEANFNGEAYSSVFFQNANFSVRVTDGFMEAVEQDADWTTHWVTDPTREGPKFKAGELLEKIALGTWKCGDPGLQYDTTINNWHTCPRSGAINASNPCSEYMFLDNSACNLASLNLMKFQRADGSFDVESFRRAVRIFTTAQEIVIDRSGYPMEKIAANSHDYRALGLGYTNLGALLMASALPYDSDEGRALCAAITAVLTGQAYLTSSEIASSIRPAAALRRAGTSGEASSRIGESALIGPFNGYETNRDAMLAVIGMHRAAVDQIDPVCPDDLLDASRRVWDECLTNGRANGFRNAQATVLAPTGTISFMMDCDTTGIEPDLALVKYKQLAGGGMFKIVNRTVPLALKVLGYGEEEQARIWKYIGENDTVEGCDDVRPEHLPVFDCAFKPRKGCRSIEWRAHVKMMAAAQPFISGAISKTVNMPKESTVDDIAEAYTEGWRRGLKALAIYRDGSKGSQPLSTATEKGDSAPADASLPPVKARPFRKRLPDTRDSVTHKFSVGGHEGYITVGLYEDGKPGELFITMAKEGSTIGGLMDVYGTAVSMGLQYGVPLEVLVKKFSHSRFDPSGWTANRDIPMATSLVDYIFRWMGIRFIPGYREKNTPVRKPESDAPSAGVSAAAAPASGRDTKKSGKTAGGTEIVGGAEVVGRAEVVGTSSNPGPAGEAGGPGKRAGSGKSAEGVSGVIGGEGLLQGVAIEEAARLQTDAPLCDNCGAITVRSGMCYLCYNCGSTSGCG
jgi:ribonucleoside-diphosphate reductase alpha chain